MLAGMTINPDALGVILYDRQSQDNRASIAEQSTAGHKRTRLEAWRLVAEYSDGSSASRFAAKTRIGWPQLLKELTRPDVDILWLWEVSRGDREAVKWLALLNLCRANNVKIYIESGDEDEGRLFNPANPRDWKQLASEGVDAEYEVLKTSLRVNRTLTARAANGTPHAHTPYGYQRIYSLDENNNRVITQVELPEQAAVVRSIYDRILKGESLRSIAARLNEAGAPPRSYRKDEAGNRTIPVPWSPGAVRDVALSPAYNGKRVHLPGVKGSGRKRQQSKDTQIIDASWAGLVPAETWHAVNVKLRDPKRRSTDRAPRGTYLISMIGKCGIDGCGAPLMVMRSRGQAWYRCSAHGHTQIRLEDADTYIEKLVVAWLSQPENLELFTEDKAADIQAARDRLAEAEADYRAWVAAAAKPGATVDPAAFAEVIAVKAATRDEAKAALAELETPAELVGYGFDAGTEAQAAWDALAPNGRRGLIRLLCKGITLHRPAQRPTVGRPSKAEERLEVEWRRAA